MPFPQDGKCGASIHGDPEATVFRCDSLVSCVRSVRKICYKCNTYHGGQHGIYGTRESYVMITVCLLMSGCLQATYTAE